MNLFDPDKIPPDYFKNKYADIIRLHGRAWIKYIPPEDRRAFAMIGFQHSGYGRKGGVQRAKTAMRDSRGRFKCNEPECNEPECNEDSENG